MVLEKASRSRFRYWQLEVCQSIANRKGEEDYEWASDDLSHITLCWNLSGHRTANARSSTQDTGTPGGSFCYWLGGRQWSWELGEQEGKRGNRWGRERLGRDHEQDLATDLTCTHVGGKLAEIDYKQCSAIVAPFLNFWECNQIHQQSCWALLNSSSSASHSKTRR